MRARRWRAVVGVLVVCLSGLAAPMSPAEAGFADATLGATPSTALVHGQEVRIVLDHWPARSFPLLRQCGPGVDGVEDLFEGPCEWLEAPRVGPGGRVRFRQPVEVILDVEDGPIDCRVVACELIATSFFSNPLLRVPLAFDPGGPDPTHLPISVTPNADLVDGQQVTVTGTGFPLEPESTTEGGPDGPPRPALIQQCRLPFGSFRDCDTESRTVSLSPEGDLEATFAVEARLSMGGGGTYDCRTGDCIVIARSLAGSWDPSEISRAPVAFDPAGPAPPPPTVHLEPGTDLRDGQLVNAVGTDFEPRQWVELYQCRAGATRLRDCHGEDDGGIGYSRRVRADGTVVYPVHLHAFIEPLEGPAIDCRVEACELFMTPATEAMDGAPATPMVFDPAAPLLAKRVVPVPGTGLVDGQRISVRLQQIFPTYAVHVMQCVGRTATSFDLSTCSDDTGRNVETADGTPRASFRGPYTVHRTMRTRAFGVVNCRVRHCFLIAMAHDGYESYFSDRLIFRAP